MTEYKNSLDDVRGALNSEWAKPDGILLRKLSASDIAILLYGARNVHQCSVSEDEYDEIMEAVHTAEAELGIEYEHDKS